MEGLLGVPVAGHGEMSSVGGLERTDPIWERPWTLEEIRNSSQSWSLAADSGLLNFLQEFSQQTISKTHEIEKQLDGLIRDTKNTNCRLHNVFNDFLMLSNTQFIENRVYDEEVAEPILKTDTGEKPEQEKTREQKEADLIPKVQEAINYGLQVLESAFEKLDIKAGNSDSEEEEVNERVGPILEPKDLYIDRPLPYIIGSQLFMEQEDVGLGEFSSEEGSIDSDRASGIDSEDEDEKEERESDESENRSEEQRLETALSDEEDDGSNLFDSDKDDEEDNLEDSTTSGKRARPTSFADELAARIKGDVPSKINENPEALSSVESMPKKQIKETKEIRNVPSDDDEEYLFKPPKLTDEVFTPFGTQGGLFSGGTGLFDDDEDDLFDIPRDTNTSEIKTPLNEDPSPSNPVRKVPVGGVSLFPGGDHVLNASSVLAAKDKNKSPTPKTDNVSKLLTNSGLFDDEDDFFVEPKTKEINSGKFAADAFVPGGDCDIFMENPDNPVLTETKVVTPSEGTKEKVAKKLPSLQDTKPVSPPPHKTHAKGLFSDEEDSEDLFSPSPVICKSKSTSLPTRKTTKGLTLFDDEEEDNLFSSAPAKTPVTVKQPKERIKAEEPTKTSRTLFNSDEEDHWNRTEPIKPISEPEQKDSLAKPNDQANRSGKDEKNISLFDDEEDDLFAITRDSQRKSQRASLLFEDDVNNEGTLFSSKPVSNSPALQILEKDTLGTVPLPLLIEKKEDSLDNNTEKNSLKVKIEAEKKPEEAVVILGQTDPFVAHKKEKVTLPVALLQDVDDGIFLGSPPLIKENQNAKKNVLSLFEDDDEENSEDLLINRNQQKEIKKPFESGPHSKSTGVFQDEELLFSHKLQRDNDPDVDLFANSKKHATERPTQAKLSTAAGLFGDEEEDDLFSTTKPKHPPMTLEKKIVKKDSSETVRLPKKIQEVKPAAISGSRRTEANLFINPAALLPGAVFKVPGAPPNLPKFGVSTSDDINGASSIIPPSKNKNGGVAVSFDHPATISTLHSANKDRIKVTAKRRPPSRAGRRLASQDSGDTDKCKAVVPPPQLTAGEASITSDVQWLQTVEPKADAFKTEVGENVFSVKSSSSSTPDFTAKNTTIPEKLQPPEIQDVFSSDDLFAKSGVSKTTMTAKAKSKVGRVKTDKNSALSILDDQGSDDDLFQTAKQKSSKKTNPSTFVANEEEDIFAVQKALKEKGVKATSNEAFKQKAQNIFEDDIFASETIKPTKKSKETKMDSNIFDDNLDIFADLTVKPKEKKVKKKAEPKSIFDDGMDDIFSSVNQSKTSKSKVRTDKSALRSKNESKVSSIFEDPLNAFGGQ
ncbi:WASH complex subunit 2C isoform X2 [Ambystoma mexicanum]|uniref:WASH complex subunit 2C isoform X2 n=1 Tax=Ambystoma mexicanum TaxID=8296 RepID=UPI0037E84369